MARKKPVQTVDEELTSEEQAAIDELNDLKNATAHISIRIRGDILDAIREEAAEVGEARGSKVGYQSLIQEILASHVARRQRVKQLKGYNAFVEQAKKELGDKLEALAAETLGKKKRGKVG